MDIDQKVQYFEKKSDENLITLIGNYALDQQSPDDIAEILFQGAWSVSRIQELGRQYLEDMAPVFKDAICGKDGILELADSAGVKDVLSVVVPALGFTPGAQIPAAIIAVCIIIVRSGLRTYCKD